MTELYLSRAVELQGPLGKAIPQQTWVFSFGVAWGLGLFKWQSFYQQGPNLASKEGTQLLHVNKKPVLAANALMLHLTWSALKNLM